MLEEHTVGDYWNADGERPPSASWIGFTRYTIPKKPLPDGHMWAGERLTKIQTTSSLDDIWLEYGRTCQKHFNKKQDSNGLQENPR